MADRWFFVRVRYREPTHDLHSETAPREFSATFEVEAGDEDEARRLTLRRFHEVAAQSSVGWGREVVSVEMASSLESPSGGR